MNNLFHWGRNLLAVLGIFALGWLAAGRGRTVYASSEDLQFQMNSGGPDSALLIYSERDHTIFFYQRPLLGNNAVQCSYRFVMGAPGGVIRREQCPPQRLLP